MPASAGTPAAACWKWAATWPPAGARQAKLAQGGTATFTGGALVTHAGSDINLSGGTLDVQDGYIRQSWLRGADGRLYDVSRAPGDLLYTGLYKGFEQVHQRWGDKATRVFYNP